MLGDDIAAYKQDLFESFFGSRAYSDVLGPYGMLLAQGPFGAFLA